MWVLTQESKCFAKTTIKVETSNYQCSLGFYQMRYSRLELLFPSVANRGPQKCFSGGGERKPHSVSLTPKDQDSTTCTCFKTCPDSMPQDWSF